MRGCVKVLNSICTHLHEMLCELAVAFPEAVKGEVHAAVVDQLPGDRLWVSLGNAVVKQTFTEDDHDALPVTARYLRPARAHRTTTDQNTVISCYKKQIPSRGLKQQTIVRKQQGGVGVP